MRPIVFFFLLLPLTSNGFAAEIGSVVYVDGQGSALRRGVEVKLQVGSTIYLKDKIRTATLGRLRVLLGNQCSIMLYGNGELNIESEVKDSQTPYIQVKLTPVVKTEDAKTRMIISQVKNPLECHLFTPNSVLRSVEGDVLVSYSNRLGLTEVVAVSGEVEVSELRSSKEDRVPNSVMLKGNDLSRITMESTPSNPVQLGVGQVNRLLDQYTWPVTIPKITNRSLPWRVITKSQ